MLSPHPGVSGPLPWHTPPLIAALGELGCEVHSAPWGRHSDSESALATLFGRAYDVFTIRREVLRSRPDVVVIKSSHEWRSLLRDIPLVAALQPRRQRVVIQFHGGHTDWLVLPGNHLFKALTRLLLRLTRGVLVLSSEEAKDIRRFRPGTRVNVVFNAFRQADLALAPPVVRDSDAGPLIVFAGRLIPEKGVFETLTAFASLRSRRPCRLVIAGDGGARAEVAERVERLGVGGDVVCAGQLERSELMALFREADVFVMPSYSEGFPTVITEAMSMGLPIVTTRLRGMADHLEEGRNALFVPPRSPAQICAALGRLLDDDQLRSRMAEANRTAVARFSPTAAAERYLEAIEQLTGHVHDGTSIGLGV
jgi:glycosyltransferase involved in cell wall biosynthesis